MTDDSHVLPTAPEVRSTAPPPPGAGISPLAYLLGAAGVTLALLVLFRVPWVQTELLVPYALAQQAVAEWVLGLEDPPVSVGFACTGADVMALCLGAVLAYPARWRSRGVAALLGLALISVVNTARIGTLSAVVHRRELFDLLHVYVWPAILIVLVTLFAVAWMRRVEVVLSARRARVTDAGFAWNRTITRRFVALTILFVALFVAASRWYLDSDWLHAAGAWVASTGAFLLGLLGAEVGVQGAIVRTSAGGFVVTPECIASPLVPVYLAAAIALTRSWRRRLLWLALAPLVFFSLGTFRLLVLAVPGVAGSFHAAAIHGFNQVVLGLLLVWVAAAWASAGEPTGETLARAGTAAGAGLAAALLLGVPATWLAVRTAAATRALAGHLEPRFDDGQGALALMLAFELGLAAALLLAVRRRSPWSRPAAAVAGAALVLLHVAFVVLCDELSAHAGVAPGAREIRAASVLLPLGLVAVLIRAGRPPDRAS